MDDEDFFKDYPPAEGSFEQSAAAAALDDDDEPADDAEPIILGAPADDDPYVADSANGTSGNGTHPATDSGAYSLADDDDTTLHAPPPDDASGAAAVENEAVTQWRRDFAARLEETMANERRVGNTRRDKATDVLNSMNSRWIGMCKQAADDNQRADREATRARDGLISRMTKPGQKPNWDLVPQLVDLSGTFKEGKRDTSRMRQVLQRMTTN